MYAIIQVISSENYIHSFIHFCLYGNYYLRLIKDHGQTIKRFYSPFFPFSFLFFIFDHRFFDVWKQQYI